MTRPSCQVSRPGSAARAMDRRGCGSRSPPRTRARRASVRVSPRTHFALFQKYRWGTSRRAGPPCSGSQRLAGVLVGHPGLARRSRPPRPGWSCSHRRTRRSDTRPRSRRRSSRVSTETPFQPVSSLRPLGHAVDVDRERAPRAARGTPPRAMTRARRPAPWIVKLHSSSGVCGVGPADSTGKSVGQVLAGRNPRGIGHRPAATQKATGDGRHHLTSSGGWQITGWAHDI